MFLWHIDYLRLINPKSIFLEGQYWYYLAYRRKDKRVPTVHKDICLKVNVIAWLEFELMYYDSTVQHFNHYTMGTSCIVFVLFVLISEMKFDN